MLFDLDQLADQSTRECDVCIVGSGAAGIAVTYALRGTGLRVLLLESGALPTEPRTQALYHTDFSAKIVKGANEGRFRTLGGSTTQWGGQALPLMPIDFAARSWIPNSGWPIDPAILEPYYRRAEAFMLTDTNNYDTDPIGVFSITPPAISGSVAHYHFSKWSKRPNLRHTYLEMLSAPGPIDIVCHANLMQILLTPSHDRVHDLVARSLTGHELRVRATHVVLAAGAIEIARLLLASNTQQRNGVGNDYDHVGRYFMDHPGGTLARVVPMQGLSSRESARAIDSVQHVFNTGYTHGIKYTPRLSAHPDLQRTHTILNASAFFSFQANPDSHFRKLRDAVSLFRYGKANLSTFSTIAQSMLKLPEIVRPVYAYSVKGRMWTPDPTMNLVVLTEQEPNPESRITLGASRDELGMPRSKINWVLTDLTRRTIQTFVGFLAEEFSRLKLCTIELDPRFQAGATNSHDNWRDAIEDQSHHMGTTRMSASPAQGVVDTHCRVHGIENLWVTSSSVFPTSGHSNPTLTLMALALRTADTIAARLGKSIGGA